MYKIHLNFNSVAKNYLCLSELLNDFNKTKIILLLTSVFKFSLKILHYKKYIYTCAILEPGT